MLLFLIDICIGHDFCKDILKPHPLTLLTPFSSLRLYHRGDCFVFAVPETHPQNSFPWNL